MGIDVEIKASGWNVPRDDVYNAKYLNYEETTINLTDEKTGTKVPTQMLRHYYKIFDRSGNELCVADEISDIKATAKNKLGRIIAAIMCRELKSGEKISLDELRNKPCRLVIKTVGGRQRITEHMGADCEAFI
jgi:hypothetical protein